MKDTPHDLVLQLREKLVTFEDALVHKDGLLLVQVAGAVSQIGFKLSKTIICPECKNIFLLHHKRTFCSDTCMKKYNWRRYCKKMGWGCRT